MTSLCHTEAIAKRIETPRVGRRSNRVQKMLTE
jgi:hypothetical protein